MDEIETRRQYVAAYRADNGNIIPLGNPNSMQEYAEIDAEKMRSPEDETEIFVAYRDLPVWTAVADAIEPSTDERCKSYGPASGEQCVKQVGHLTAHESNFRSTWEYPNPRGRRNRE